MREQLPDPPEHASLGGIGALRDLGLARVGYSDHTTGVRTGRSPSRPGRACSKSTSPSTAAKGPDHAASLDPARFRQYVEKARSAFVMLGPRAKRMLAIESDVRTLSRQSVIAACEPRRLDARAVELTIRRPGTGIAPFRLAELSGRKLARDVAAGTPLTDADLA